MRAGIPKQARPWFAWTVCVVLASPAAAPGQGTSGPTVRDSSVGYIDAAVPGTLLRLRYDAAYDFRRPTRAEFFYARSGPPGPGLPFAESGVDFQDVAAHLEFAPGPRLSAFVELPVRFLNPEVNENSAGFADLNAGFKYALVYRPDLVGTFQLRTYAPTGDADRGLGTNHVSLEPAFLLFRRLGERLCLEGEFRTWVAVGGTGLAGDLIRYGLGLRYDLGRVGPVQVLPVAELVGWTVLHGKANVLPPSRVPFVEDSAGDTILNVKAGLRLRLGDRADFYTGYGRPLTGDRWYENILRVEMRLFF